MRVLLRCDGSATTGLGHVVRCVALAEEALLRGHEVAFAGTLQGRLVEVLLDGLEPRVQIHQLSSDSTLTDLAALSAGYDVLHVDDYGLPTGLRDVIRSDAQGRGTTPLLSNMHDGRFGDRPADLCIDAAPRSARLTPRANAWSLRGLEYAPLRRSLLGRQSPIRTDDAATRVLVVMGGTDATGAAPAVVEALVRTGMPLEITVIADVATEERLRRLQAEGLASIEISPPLADLSSAVAAADVVVSASGTTVWELCVMGKPMAIVAVVDNQRLGYDAVIRAGAAVGLGDRHGVETPEAVSALRELLTDRRLRHHLGERARRLVDGLGAWRIVSAWEAIRLENASRAAVEPNSIALREATLADSEILLAWRNDPETRRASRHAGEVQPAEHLTWLRSTLSRKDRILMVASDPRGLVGTVRWDSVEADVWEVSITVAPERRGQRCASPLLTAAEAALVVARPETASFVASVHAANAYSRRLFLGCGYLPDLPADPSGVLRYRKLP